MILLSVNYSDVKNKWKFSNFNLWIRVEPMHQVLYLVLWGLLSIPDDTFNFQFLPNGRSLLLQFNFFLFYWSYFSLVIALCSALCGQEFSFGSIDLLEPYYFQVCSKKDYDVKTHWDIIEQGLLCAHFGPGCLLFQHPCFGSPSWQVRWYNSL